MRRLLVTMAALAALPLGAAPADAATIKTDTLSDELSPDGDCSLREAVESANSNSSFDECQKGQSGKPDVVKLEAAEYMLTRASTDEDSNLNGDLDFTGGGKLEIRGAKGGGTHISSQEADRVIHATDGAGTLVLTLVFLEQGDATTLEPNDGGNVLVQGGRLVMSKSDVLGGTASVGGGVFLDTASATIRNSYFSLNESGFGGGAVAFDRDPGSRIERSIFIENSADTGDASGGAIHHQGDALKVSRSSFIDNTATTSGVDSARGGAVHGGNLDIRQSFFRDNEATADTGGEGGAVSAFEGRIVNSTFYSNSVDGEGGAIKATGSLSHLTFLANTADEAGDHVAAQNGGPFGEPLTLRNSILPGASIAVDLCSEDLGTIQSKGMNVMTYDDPDCGTLDSDVVTGGSTGLASDPADNGGPTPTLAIGADSPARNLITKQKCRSAKGVDQRGYERPAGKRCDAGAFERGAQPGR